MTTKPANRTQTQTKLHKKISHVLLLILELDTLCVIYFTHLYISISEVVILIIWKKLILRIKFIHFSGRLIIIFTSGVFIFFHFE